MIPLDRVRELIAAAPDLARALVAAVDALRAEREARATAEASVAQLRADLERADFDRQRVEGERDAIAEAAGGFLTAADAHESEATRWQREYIPNHTAHAVVIVAARDAADAARTRLDALLSDAPPPATVPAALVRRQIGAVLAANGCDCDCDHSSDEHDDDCDRCLACRVEGALDAALAGCV